MLCKPFEFSGFANSVVAAGTRSGGTDGAVNVNVSKSLHQLFVTQGAAEDNEVLVAFDVAVVDEVTLATEPGVVDGPSGCRPNSDSIGAKQEVKDGTQ